MTPKQAYKLGFVRGVASGVSSVDSLTQELRQMADNMSESVGIELPTNNEAPLPKGTEPTGRFFNEFHRVGQPHGYAQMGQYLPPDTSV